MSDETPKDPVKPPPLPLTLVTGTTMPPSVRPRVIELKSPTVLEAIDGLREALHERLSSLEVEVGLLRKATRTARAEADTLPGIQAPELPAAPTLPRKLANHSLASVKWSLVLVGLLGVAAQLATIRYPRLVGPLQTLQQIVEEVSGTHVQQTPVPGSP